MAGQAPQFKIHFIPTHASWMNLVEVWFGIIERQVIRRGVFTSVKDLNTKIRAFMDGWSERSHPFVWTKPPTRSSLKPTVQQLQIPATRCRRLACGRARSTARQRTFRPPPHPSSGPLHAREGSRSRKHLAAAPWTPPPSRLGFGIYRVRGRNGEPCLVAANSSTFLRGMLPPPPTSSKGIALTASSRTWSAPRRRETSASPPGSGSPSCPPR
jgi:hypothetical protein